MTRPSRPLPPGNEPIRVTEVLRVLANARASLGDHDTRVNVRQKSVAWEGLSLVELFPVYCGSLQGLRPFS